MKAVLPVFDENRSKPYYLQLYEYLKNSILNGDVAENEKLPSLRNLAKSTGLSITTIEQAYNQLLVEGYIEANLNQVIMQPKSFLIPDKLYLPQAIFYVQKCSPIMETAIPLFRKCCLILNASILTSGRNV